MRLERDLQQITLLGPGRESSRRADALHIINNRGDLCEVAESKVFTHQ